MKQAVLAAFFISVLLSQLFAVQSGTFHADGDRSKNAIALSFDDGPGPNTQAVMQILDEYKIKATFFMNGDQVEMRPTLAKEVLQRGFEIGEHTYSHMNFYAYEKKYGTEKTKEKIRSEIQKSKDLIRKATGISPQLCRMPHGYQRPWLGEIAKDFGYALVNWTFGEDWLNIPEEKMASDYLKHVRSGNILLFHDGGKNREKTLKILPQVIREAKKKNLAFLTVSEILGN